MAHRLHPDQPPSGGSQHLLSSFIPRRLKHISMLKQQEHTQHNDLFPAFFNLDQIRIKLKAVNLRSRGIVEVSVQAEHESGV